MAARGDVPSVSMVLPAASFDSARHFSAFMGMLDQKGQALLVRRLHHVSLPGGGLLFRQGESGEAVYFVVSGRLAVLVTRDDGRQIRIAEAGPGEVVGEMALVSEEPRRASARALRDCSLLRLSKAAYEALIAREPYALAPFEHAMAERVARTARAGQAVSAIRASSPVSLEECAAAAAITDPAALDLAVRQLYHRLAADLAVVLGAQDVNWFAFASRSSNRVALPIRAEDLPVLPLVVRVIAPVLPGGLAVRLRRWRVVDHAATVLRRVDEHLVNGVRRLVADIAPPFVQLIARAADENPTDRARVASPAGARDCGTSDRQGMHLLAEAVRLYDEASAETDAKIRAELILLGTTRIALFEQRQLESLVPGAIEDALAGWVASAAPWLARLPRWLRAEEWADELTRRLARRLVWSRLVRVRLPYGDPRRGNDLPRGSARLPLPAPLASFANAELAALFERFDQGRAGRAVEWSDLHDRMRYLAKLFRAHQRNLELFEPPALDDGFLGS